MKDIDFYDSDVTPEQTIGESTPRRHYIGIHFECCGIYDRVYRNPDDNEYRGRCPRCLRAVRVRVGPSGTRARIFRAT